MRILGHGEELNNDERKSRIKMFYRSELRNFILYQLREGPKTSRQLAEILLRSEAKGQSDATALRRGTSNDEKLEINAGLKFREGPQGRSWSALFVVLSEN